jgi:hypothetical protein
MRRLWFCMLDLTFLQHLILFHFGSTLEWRDAKYTLPYAPFPIPWAIENQNPPFPHASAHVDMDAPTRPYKGE